MLVLHEFEGMEYKEIAKVVVGQHAMVERILIGLLTGGHCLIEGVPGLAKTLLVKTLSQTINASFSLSVPIVIRSCVPRRPPDA